MLSKRINFYNITGASKMLSKFYNISSGSGAGSSDMASRTIAYHYYLCFLLLCLSTLVQSASGSVSDPGWMILWVDLSSSSLISCLNFFTHSGVWSLGDRTGVGVGGGGSLVVDNPSSSPDRGHGA